MRLHVSLCAECEPVTLGYWEAGQVEPEIAPLWKWFGDHVDPSWTPPRGP